MRKIKRTILFVLRWLPAPRNVLFNLLHGIGMNVTCQYYGLPHIRKGGRGSEIRIGRNFVANSDWKRNSFGIIQPVMIRTVGHGARIIIGDNVGVSGCSISAGLSIIIGDNVLVGSGAVISDGDAHPVDLLSRRAGLPGKRAPVVVEDDVFIGARAIVLKGVTVGRGSVVGAGSVVVKNVPPYSVVAGNPARVVGRVSCGGIA